MLSTYSALEPKRETINANLLKFNNNESQPMKNNYYDQAPSKDKDQPG